MKKEIEKIIADIIQHEMDLPDDYGKTFKGDIIPCILIYGQNAKLFNTDKLQITIKNISSKVYSSRTEYKTNPNPTESDGSDAFIEEQNINLGQMFQVDIYSRNNEARQRYWEVSTALKSTYAEQQMDLYNFKIGTITNAVNISGADGGSVINRFTVTFNVITHQQKIKFINYYDKFPATLQDERGLIGNFLNTEQ